MYQQVLHPPISKPMLPYTVVPSFSIPRSESTIWRTNIVSVTNLVLQEYTLKDTTLSYFYISYFLISFQKIFVKFSHKAICPTMAGKTFKFMVFRLQENAFATQKTNIDVFAQVPHWQNCPPGAYHHSQCRNKLLISPGSVFSKIFFPPAKRRGKRGNYE